jgi:S-adenosylmethionine decarboxylase
MKMVKTSIYNLRFWLLETDASLLKEHLHKFLSEAGYGIVGFSEHQFQPQGYTAIWLLSESHLALHTYPEEERSYVELSGCSKEMNERFKSLCHLQWPDKIQQEELAIM